jgi:hypothetical protein
MRAPLVCLLLLGCASNYYETYRSTHEGWVSDLPTAGMSLPETLAGIYAPPVADYSRIIAKLDVLALEDGAVRRLTADEVAAAFEQDASGDYGVVATLRCQSEYDLKRYMGEKVAWYLLVDGKLAAYDHFDFVDRCTVANSFLPAAGEKVALERRVTDHRDARFPRSMEHEAEYYRKGIAYIAAGRRDDALRMLEAGDRTLDVGERGARRVDYGNAPSGLRQTRGADIDRSRAQLVQALDSSASDAAPAQ